MQAEPIRLWQVLPTCPWPRRTVRLLCHVGRSSVNPCVQRDETVCSPISNTPCPSSHRVRSIPGCTEEWGACEVHDEGAAAISSCICTKAASPVTTALLSSTSCIMLMGATFEICSLTFIVQLGEFKCRSYPEGCLRNVDLFVFICDLNFLIS